MLALNLIKISRGLVIFESLCSSFSIFLFKVNQSILTSKFNDFFRSPTYKMDKEEKALLMYE